MQLELHYINLCDALGEQTYGKAVPYTVEELASVFDCTQRNAKLVLRRMEELQWVEWHPGRGRGNKSSITLRADREQRLLDVAKRHVDQGNVREALQLIQLRSRNKDDMTRFSDWLTDFFGYRRQGESERRLESLRVPAAYYVGSLDPSKVHYVGEGHLVRQLFDTLVGYDFDHETLVPKLAHHWESNEERTEWTFYLRKGVLFHHRREMTADDVLYTFERLQSHHNYFIIKRVAAPDCRTVSFELHEPCVWFPRMVSFDSTSILPKELAEAQGDSFFELPVGTGPFQLFKRTPALCVLDAFPAYYGGRAHLDRVELHFVPAVSESGFSWDLIDKAPEPAPENTSFQRIRNDWVCCRLLTFNFRLPGPQQHPSFRRAVAEAIDKEAMLAAQYDDRFTAAYGFTPECSTRPDRATALSKEQRDRLIRELLKEAGYDGSAVTLQTTGSSSCKLDAERVRDACASYGIRIELIHRSYAETDFAGQAATAHMTLQNVVFEDEELTFLDFIYSEGSAIGFHLLEESTKRLGKEYVRRMFAEETQAGRWKWIRKLSGLVQENHSIVFLFHFMTESYFNPRIGGVRFNSLGLIDFKNVWFKG
ncbi:ABC transporter substrate-binding protein [Paenibacillus thermotolerans]|uniref:ABC transporter substrate-binding protein n=1 Tax=Paenibacillus thermotolerans TaxID=3027807 RepID=UPI002368C683|nr:MULTISPECIES: ABC transporter substrate-binding protein [unclassified Paenibacillus]